MIFLNYLKKQALLILALGISTWIIRESITTVKLYPVAPIPSPWLVYGIVLALTVLCFLTRKNPKMSYLIIPIFLAVSWDLLAKSALSLHAYIRSLPLLSYSAAYWIGIASIVFAFVCVALLTFVIWRYTDKYIAVRAGPRGVKIEKNPRKTKYNKKESQGHDIDLGEDLETKKTIQLEANSRFLHTIVMGTTGTGKTSMIFRPAIYQDILRMQAGENLSISVIEPTGDLVESIATICDQLGVRYVYINPEDVNTKKFNPLEGDSETVAEITRTILRSLFGKQDAFFAQVQETASRNVILLLKRFHGDDLKISDVARTLRDMHVLKKYVDELEKTDGETDLVQYFKIELLGKLKDKYQQFAMGLRMQLEDISGNQLLKNILEHKSDINLDEHLKGGTVFLVNTSLGKLGKLGNTFGQFIIMHIQHAVFRTTGTEWDRTPHYLYVDEFPCYINPDFERLLAIGRKYRCACMVAMQSYSQLEIEGKRAFSDNIMNSCRNKIIFGGMEGQDALRFQRELGKDEYVQKQYTYDTKIITPELFPDKYRTTLKEVERYSSTYLQELPFGHYVYRFVTNNKLDEPREASGRFLDDKTIGKKVEKSNGAKKPTLRERFAKMTAKKSEKPKKQIQIVTTEEFSEDNFFTE